MEYFSFWIIYITKYCLRKLFIFLNGGEKCIVCGKKTFLYPICNSCIKKHFSIENALSKKRCSICGKELISTSEKCLQCRESVVIKNVDCMIPLFSYRLWNKEIMFIWKSQGVRTLSDLFARFFSETLKKLNIDTVVPVPPRPGKIKTKGWDQIDEVCTQLKFKYGIKVLKLLERKGTVQQKKLDRIERLNTIGNSYFLKNEYKIQKELKQFHGILPEKICIIDDVCTTGSTIESCSIILKTLGVNQIYGLTLFIVD